MSERAGLFEGADGALRCRWCESTQIYRDYHDSEWGFPVTDDRRLFEKLCLEGFQAGLSWLTILNKREAFRRGFAQFDAEQVARFGAEDVARLLGDAGIVRHRGKIESAINNAQIHLFLAKPWVDAELRKAIVDALVTHERQRERDELADLGRVHQGTMSLHERELKRLAGSNPALARVNWSEDGGVLLEPEDDA